MGRSDVKDVAGPEEAESLLLSAREIAVGSRGRRLRTAGLLVVGLLAVAVLMLMLRRPGDAVRHPVAELDGMAEKEEKNKCSGTHPGESCLHTKCCTQPGTQCFTKDSKWAICRAACRPGPDPTDMNNQTWECKALGPRKAGHYSPPSPPVMAPWVAKTCSGPGENCTETRCCKDAGNACFKKDAKWSSCKPSCTPGPDPVDTSSSPWECKQLGMRSPGWPRNAPKAAPWVAKKCSKDGEDCSKTRCCTEAGMQCFRKNSHTAKCLVGCHPGPHTDDKNSHPWNCTALGGRTPGTPTPHPVKVAPWVKKECTKSNTENCLKTQCCKEGGMQCYQGNKNWASCLPSCTQWKQWSVNGKMVDAKTKKPWMCKKLGPRTPRAWHSPSLFCISVFRLNNEEANLMRNALGKGIGIFACDNYAVFSSDPNSDLGDGPLGELRTVHFTAVPVGISKDGTAANTGLFMNVWEAVRWDGRYRTCDWTIKADPDAVLLPDRLRTHLKPHSGHSAFILTCGKAGMPDGPMMFGSVEALSRMALDSYFNSESTCRNMPWGAWGEDLWLGNCLKNLGVSAEADFNLVSDGVCLYRNCADKNAAAFHPLKSVHEWLSCYWGATR